MELVPHFVEAALSLCEKGSTEAAIVEQKQRCVRDHRQSLINLSSLMETLQQGFRFSTRVHTDILERSITKPRVSVCEGTADTDI